MDNKICPKCGASIPEENNFCTECGAKFDETPAAAQSEPVTEIPQPAPQPEPEQTFVPQPTGYYTEPAPSKKSEYALITPWGWVGITLILALPILGPIFLIVWACGGCRKIQKRNYARGLLLNALIGLVLTIVLTILLVGPLKSKVEEFNAGIKDKVESTENSNDTLNDILAKFGLQTIN